MKQIYFFSLKILIKYLCFYMYIFPDTANAGINQRKLLKMLFSEYNSLERPVENETDTLEVTVGLAVQQIVDLDEKMQILKSSGWLIMAWKDYKLKWNPFEYGNITKIRVPATNIWTPDLLLYNTADDSYDTSLKVNAVIEYTGKVEYLPPVMLKSTCPIAIADFPFDEQECSLKFGSWTHDESKINLTALSETAQLDSFSPNGEWDLRSVKSYRESLKYDCCVEKYPFVLFTFHIRRRTLYFIFNFFFPCVLISLMAILGFALPSDSGEKMGLEITTLLSIIMFLQLITDIIPESSNGVPKIGLYFASVILICTISVISNVVVLMFHHRNVKIHNMPQWIKKWICGYLAHLLRMKCPKKNTDIKNLGRNNSLNCFPSKYQNVFNNRINDFIIRDELGMIENEKKNLDLSSISYGKKKNIDTNKFSSNDLRIFNKNKNRILAVSEKNENELHILKKEMSILIKEVCEITKKIKDDNDDEEKSLDWKFAGMVLDKLCLYLFSTLTIFSTGAIILSSPNFFKFK